MIAASVDDLPDPVGPVTSTMPFFNVEQSAIAGGRPRSWIDGIFCAIMRMTIANEPRWRNTLTRKRQRSGSAYERSDEPVSSSVRRYGLVVANQIAGDSGGVLGAKRRQLRDRHGDQLAVALNLGRTSGRKHQVADAVARIQHLLNQNRRGDRARVGCAKQRPIQLGDGHFGSLLHEAMSLPHLDAIGSSSADTRDTRSAGTCHDARPSAITLALDPDQVRTGAQVGDAQRRPARGLPVDEDIAARRRIDRQRADII